MTTSRRVAACAVVALFAVSCGGSAVEPAIDRDGGRLVAELVEEPTSVDTTATALVEANASPTDDATPTDDASSDDASEPDDGSSDAPTEPTETPDPEPSGPTDADRARFVASHRPEGSADLEHVAVDLDDDGTTELVFAWVDTGSRSSRVELVTWNGSMYEISHVQTGGAADEVARLGISDINGDGRLEIVVHQRAGTSGASATVWAVNARLRLDAVTAVGGCNDGTATYGVVGVSFRDDDADGVQEIVATCDDSPLPPSAWSEQRYVWIDGFYRAVVGDTARG